MTVKRELHDDDAETLPDMGLQFVSILSKPTRNRSNQIDGVKYLIGDLCFETLDLLLKPLVLG
ncbi:hypothetical protein ACSBR1_018567 [Camellia fascicularis]